MKKTLFVAVMAAVLVLAFTSTAMAALSDAYVTWDDAKLSLDGTADTPHIGYTVATEKCAVCHAAHAAPTDGATVAGEWTATGDTQMLLRSSVADACTFCHITTAIGGIQLYNGDASLYTGAYTANTLDSHSAHNGSNGSSRCSTCHAVHGAGTYEGPAASKLLKVSATGGFLATQDEVIDPVTGLYASQADAKIDTGNLGKNYQVTVFCSQCHPNFTGSSEATLNADGDRLVVAGYSDGTDGGGYGPALGVQYKSHPMKAADTNFSAAGGSFTGQVAFAASTTCRSCHDAGTTDAVAGVYDSSFPHFTKDAYMFMNVATSTVDAAHAGGENKATDGVCLKCHRDGVAGVGVTF